jgi:hypothetical protein
MSLVIHTYLIHTYTTYRHTGGWNVTGDTYIPHTYIYHIRMHDTMHVANNSDARSADFLPTVRRFLRTERRICMYGAKNSALVHHDSALRASSRALLFWLTLIYGAQTFCSSSTALDSIELRVGSRPGTGGVHTTQPAARSLRPLIGREPS